MKAKLSFSIFCGFLTVLFVWLGVWQVQRLHWKENLIRQYEQQNKAPAIAITPADFPKITRDWDHRRVKITGEYYVSGLPDGGTGDSSFYLQSQVRNEQVGYNVITPLDLPDPHGDYTVASGEDFFGYSAVAINRGWIPQDRRGKVPLPSGPVTIEGLIHFSLQKKPLFIPANVATNSNNGDYGSAQLFWMDLNFIMLNCCASNVGDQPDFYIDLLSSSAQSPGQPLPNAAMPDLPNNHLQYAITWFALALITLVMSGVYLRRRA